MAEYSTSSTASFLSRARARSRPRLHRGTEAAAQSGPRSTLDISVDSIGHVRKSCRPMDDVPARIGEDLTCTISGLPGHPAFTADARVRCLTEGRIGRVAHKGP
jgi:hypothetical protein